MNPKLMLIGHWVLNVIFFLAGLSLVYLSIFGASADPAHPVTDFNRLMTLVCGMAFLTGGVLFTRYTLKKG